MRTILLIIPVLVCLWATAPARADEFASGAKFSFSLGSSAKSSLPTASAFAVLTDELFNGKTDAIEIFFLDHALTAEERAEIQNNRGGSLREKYSAVMVLFLDKKFNIWQVNATCVIPGNTVAYTVAWKPEDLKQFFSDYAFDGKTLKLRSVGQYRDVNVQKEPIELDWDVNVDIPVIDERRPKGGAS